MERTIGRSAVALLGLSILVATSGLAAAQQSAWQNGADWRGSEQRVAANSGAAAPAPNQPVQPNLPTLEPRAPQPPAANLQLSPEQQAKVDQVLQSWEERGAGVKNFACNFQRWIYDKTQVKADNPQGLIRVELGIIKYGAPDKGLFKTEQVIANGAAQPIEPVMATHWVCDGKSLYEYRYPSKQVVQTPIPPEMQGKAITNSPLPFLFGAKADDLRRRYFIKIITPPESADKITTLLAMPRYQNGAADFQAATLVLNNRDMQPIALQLVAPGGNQWTSYQFKDIVVNDLFGFLKGDPFSVALPDRDWQIVLDNSAAPAGPQGTPPTTGMPTTPSMPR